MKDMTLSQEYLVCAVNEKGKIGSMNIEKVVCLLAAGLLELQLAECITMDKKAATVTAPLPQDKEYLRSLYDYIGSGKGGSIKMDKLLESYTYSLTSKQVRALMGGIGGELEKMGLATRTPATFLSNEGLHTGQGSTGSGDRPCAIRAFGGGRGPPRTSPRWSSCWKRPASSKTTSPPMSADR